VFDVGLIILNLIQQKSLIRKLNGKDSVFFFQPSSKDSTSAIIEHLSVSTRGPKKLVGCRVLVVGMPNVGKSTLINALRSAGVKKAKAAMTGDQPGITRKIGTPIKIIEEGKGPDVYVLDTPGVFVPYVPDADRMLKLSLCGCVKDSIIPSPTVAEFLLFHINLHDPQLYQQWHEPTNDIIALLDSYARQAGYLGPGGVPNFNLAALNFIQRWRAGKLGKFVLDDIPAEIRRRKAENPQKTYTQKSKAATAARLAESRSGIKWVNWSLSGSVTLKKGMAKLRKRKWI
jgi:mitochondrial GTPase 1